MPPRNAISVPERRGAYMSALADVLVNLGSTLMIFAPLSLALRTHFIAIGWFSAVLLPQINIQSLTPISVQLLVIAPRSNDSARAATVELCQRRASNSKYTTPRER